MIASPGLPAPPADLSSVLHGPDTGENLGRSTCRSSDMAQGVDDRDADRFCLVNPGIGFDES